MSIDRLRRAGPLVLLALLFSASVPNANAQTITSLAQGVKLKEPVANRVYQRGRDGRADIPIALDDSVKEGTIVSVSVSGVSGEAHVEEGKVLGVPTGGPYFLNARIKVGNNEQSAIVNNVFVGDLWVLAGQSNMQGVGDLVDVAPSDPMVMLLGMNGQWSRAEEPLHWLVDSPDPVHSGDPSTREERSIKDHKTRVKGAGLGLPFASALVQATRVPIGLVACAHGGTSMAQWDPAKKDDGGKSLYGSMIRQIGLAGGKVKGILWYQGESDANPTAAEVYPKKFADFIAAVRDDLKQPDLPFYYVQIGRVVRAGDPKAWNALQDAQRRLIERVPNTAVVSVIDLELDDGIHVATQGLKRAGQRLARIAQRELFGQVGATTPTFDRVNRGAGNTLVVKLQGVNIAPAASPGDAVVGLKPARHIAGFSLRKDDGTEIPLIYDAAVGNARDTVILKLNAALPEHANLWYGYGFDTFCNLTDGLDMSVPVFGPISLDQNDK